MSDWASLEALAMMAMTSSPMGTLLPKPCAGAGGRAVGDSRRSGGSSAVSALAGMPKCSSSCIGSLVSGWTKKMPSSRSIESIWGSGPGRADGELGRPVEGPFRILREAVIDTRRCRHGRMIA